MARKAVEAANEHGTFVAADLNYRSKVEPNKTKARAINQKLAPHLSEAELISAKSRKVHRLTIDRQLQSSLQVLAARHARALGARLSAAILVVDHGTGEVRAHVGSAGYLDAERFGAIDMVNAVRSPGSALKPVIYGMAFDAGLAHPETLIEDRPTRFGAYRPKNFDDLLIR